MEQSVLPKAWTWGWEQTGLLLLVSPKAQEPVWLDEVTQQDGVPGLHITCHLWLTEQVILPSQLCVLP